MEINVVFERIKEASDAEINARNLIAWATEREGSSNLTEVVFCPKELTEGNITDYIAEAHSMLSAYERKKYTDITNIIL